MPPTTAAVKNHMPLKYIDDFDSDEEQSGEGNQSNEYEIVMESEHPLSTLQPHSRPPATALDHNPKKQSATKVVHYQIDLDSLSRQQSQTLPIAA